MKRTRFKQLVIDHLLQAKGGLAVAALCLLGFTLAGLLAPWPLKIVIDHILLNLPLPPFLSFFQPVLKLGKAASLGLIASSLILIALTRGLFSYFQMYITSRIGFEIAHALRRQLFIHLQRLSLSFHNRSRSGELLTKITSDINSLKDIFADSALAFGAHLLTLAGMLAIMFALNWRLSLVVVVTFPLLVYSLFAVYRKLRLSVRNQRKKEGRIASRINEVLTAVSMVQVFGREDHEVRKFDTEGASTLQESVQAARLWATAEGALEIMSAVASGAVLLFGALLVLDGAMLPGELLIFISYVNSLFKPIRNLAKLSNKFSRAAVGGERISEILEIEPEIQESPQAVPAVNLAGHVVFDNVSFSYGDGKAALENISFVIAPGQKVALVGASGAGKSTIASLMLRLYDPQQGSISIDGVNLNDYQLDSLRQQIGMVLQNSVLFGASIQENIAYGKLDASMDEIVCAAELANAHEFIQGLAHGYDTMISERGDSLSGGQRQRVAIARALIRNSPILILDEPMTGLDVESEARVLDALKRLMAGRTSLLITHDLQAVADVDWVLLLEDGRIIEQGPHSELVAHSRRYRQLHDLSSGDTRSRLATASLERR